MPMSLSACFTFLEANLLSRQSAWDRSLQDVGVCSIFLRVWSDQNQILVHVPLLLTICIVGLCGWRIWWIVLNLFVIFIFSVHLSFGICPHMTDDNKDQLKGKDVLVAYYDVDYDKNPKGSNYWRNRWVSLNSSRVPHLHTVAVDFLSLSSNLSLLVFLNTEKSQAMFVLCGFVQGDEGGQELPGSGQEAELCRCQQGCVQPRRVRVWPGWQLRRTASGGHPHCQGRQIRHGWGVLVSHVKWSFCHLPQVHFKHPNLPHVAHKLRKT